MIIGKTLNLDSIRIIELGTTYLFQWIFLAMVPIRAILRSTFAMCQWEWPYLYYDVTGQTLNFCNIFVVEV